MVRIPQFKKSCAKAFRYENNLVYTDQWQAVHCACDTETIFKKTGNERNSEARWRNDCCHGKTIIIAYSECVSVALVIQHARHMCRITSMLLSVTSLALQHFSTLSHERYDFW